VLVTHWEVLVLARPNCFNSKISANEGLVRSDAHDTVGSDHYLLGTVRLLLVVGALVRLKQLGLEGIQLLLRLGLEAGVGPLLLEVSNLLLVSYKNIALLTNVVARVVQDSIAHHLHRVVEARLA